MAEEELSVVTLQDNYYRDNFGRVLVIIICLSVSLVLLIAVSIYNFMNKPPPITFRVAKEWRVMAPVPIQQPYLSTADVMQWVSNVVPSAFNTSFMHIDDQLDSIKGNFTDNGYQVFLNQFNNYIDKDTMQTFKMFTHGEPTGAPSIINEGVLTGRYAWWVQIPISIYYSGLKTISPVDLKLQVLVVRAETTNNLTGILIDNIIVEKIGLGSLSTEPGTTK